MKCPCGCQRPVPHNKFWFSNECAIKGRSLGIRMPLTRSALELKLHKNRTKYIPVERIRFGKSRSMETRKKISNSMKEYKSKAREGLM